MYPLPSWTDRQTPLKTLPSFVPMYVVSKNGLSLQINRKNSAVFRKIEETRKSFCIKMQEVHAYAISCPWHVLLWGRGRREERGGTPVLVLGRGGGTPVLVLARGRGCSCPGTGQGVPCPRTWLGYPTPWGPHAPTPAQGNLARTSTEVCYPPPSPLPPNPPPR